MWSRPPRSRGLGTGIGAAVVACLLALIGAGTGAAAASGVAPSHGTRHVTHVLAHFGAPADHKAKPSLAAAGTAAKRSGPLPTWAPAVVGLVGALALGAVALVRRRRTSTAAEATALRGHASRAPPALVVAS
jgi:hypothetical protein